MHRNSESEFPVRLQSTGHKAAATELRSRYSGILQETVETAAKEIPFFETEKRIIACTGRSYGSATPVDDIFRRKMSTVDSDGGN